MTQQFYMRGYNSASPGTVGYVDWVVNDIPDSIASFIPSPYLSSNVHNITVNKVVTSKVNNFLNPNSVPSLISPNYTNPVDGYFLHLNSYDWLNPVPPNLTTSLPPVNEPIGLAIVRGTSNGTTLNPYSSLFWKESASQWIFAQILANGSIGASQNVSMGALNIVGYLGLQQNSSTDPGFHEALAGLIRLPNNQSDATGASGAIRARNANNTGDVTLLAADGYSRVQVGSATDPVYMPDTLRVDVAITNLFDSASTSVSQSGFIRNPNNTNIITARNAAASADLILLGSDASNHILYGSAAANAGHIFNTIVGGIYDFRINSISQVQLAANTITFTNTDTTPTVSQANITGTSTAQNIILQSQTATNGGAVGQGNVIASIPGAAAGGGSRGYFQVQYNNVVEWQMGVRSDNSTLAAIYALPATNAPTGSNFIIQCDGSSTWLNSPTSSGINIMVNGTTEMAFTAASIVLTPASLQWLTSVTNPILSQSNNTTNSATAQNLTVQAQNATGTTSIGGNLVLTSGTGTSTNGTINLQVGGTTTASLITNKFVTTKGRRRNVTPTTISYGVLATDDIIAVGTTVAGITITLPASPVTGDSYDVKDTVGLAATNVITISGNGINIDSAATYTINSNYGGATIIFTGTIWSVI